MRSVNIRIILTTFLGLALVYCAGSWFFWNYMMFPMVNSLNFSPDGKTLAGSGDWHPAHSGPLEGTGVVRLWDVQSGQTKHRFGNLPFAVWVVFSPDGTRIASGESRDSCSVWNVETGKQEQANVSKPALIANPDFLPVPYNITWFANLKVLNAWKEQEKRLERLTGGARNKNRYPVALSHDAKFAAFIEEGAQSGASKLQLWDVRRGRMQAALGTDAWKARAVVFSKDGKILVAAGSPNEISVFDVQSGKLLRRVTAQTIDSLRLLAVSNDGSKVALGDGYGLIELWDVRNGKLLHAWKID